MFCKTTIIMNTAIANKLKSLRKQKGWSQEQVADYLCVSQSAYARMESGESNSWANHLEKISEIFEIEIAELFKQEKVVINNNQQGGVGYAETINQLSEKLIEQFEERIKEKDEIIKELKETISLLKSKK